MSITKDNAPDSALTPYPDGGPPRITDDQVLAAMDKYGGRFVRQLVYLYQMADPDNKAKIKATWSNYWADYTYIAARHSHLIDLTDVHFSNH